MRSFFIYMYLYAIRTSVVFYSYAIRMSLACTRMSSVYHSYAIRMSLVCGFTMNPYLCLDHGHA